MRDLPVPMRDGVELLADRLDPGIPDAPIVLVRTPYGRGGLVGLLSRLIAERGYQVLTQSCRGTHGSGGIFLPFRDEERDGLDTLDWLERQPWFTGSVGTFGGSYMGITQWALAGARRKWLKAMVIAVAAADVGGSVIYPRGVFALETALSWAVGQDSPAGSLPGLLWKVFRVSRAMPRATATLPLADGDAAIIGPGRHVGFYQDWLAHPDPGDKWWAEVDHRSKREQAPPAVYMSAGWYDIFLPWQLDDFTALQRSGREVAITIGPWGHGGGTDGASRLLNGALNWFDIHLHGAGHPKRPAVRACLMGTGRWVELDTWPLPATGDLWFLQPGGGLATTMAPDSPPDSYHYDPADPTPAAGGASLSGASSGPKNQVVREARPDVLLYTSAPLERMLTVLGPVSAELHVASDADSADFVVTVADVDLDGRSTNVTTGVARCAGSPLAAGTCVRVELWPTGYEFQPGHRIRVQVASAAHPIYARNLGTGEPPARATRLRPSTQTVFHDPARPSSMALRLITG